MWLFERTSTYMKTGPSEVVFAGNDKYNDIHGAQKLGMKTI
jgi:FMN phosphatase YigB (HAD superfamily)